MAEEVHLVLDAVLRVGNDIFGHLRRSTSVVRIVRVLELVEKNVGLSEHTVSVACPCPPAAARISSSVLHSVPPVVQLHVAQAP